MNFDVLNNFSEQPEECEMTEQAQGIAIIGIHAQIGSTKSAEEFWEAVRNGRDMICDFPNGRWKDVNDIYQKKYKRGLPDELAQEAYLDRIDLFDAEFFHITPAEARLMSPLQRLFLESAWTAIEDAGYGGDLIKGTRTGVYVGYSKMGTQYEELAEEESEGYSGVLVSGNVTSLIASRISYLLNLRGPAMITDTACSSSLVALHLACKQLLDREIDMAVVGGIRLAILPAEKNREHMGIESSSERTKTFDNSADGTGGGEGVISVVLKPLVQAQEDGDSIYAVIKGSSINQDGSSIGITAPNVAAQEDVIVNAWKDARIEPETISYVEAHGTATNLGDPVEMEGLKRAFEKYTDRKQFCYIGSVKTNVGHLDAAAGLAGLLKVIMMLKYKKLPPCLYFQTPNKKIDFTASPMVVNDLVRDWEQEGKTRRCGISSFGISGTNCHVILEEYVSKQKENKQQRNPYQIVTMSAITKVQVIQIFKSYQEFLMRHPDCDFEDFCYTANAGRGHYTCRLAVIVKSKADFLSVNLTEETIGKQAEEYYYDEHKITDRKMKTDSRCITEEEQQKLSAQADYLLHEMKEDQSKEILQAFISLYIGGANPDWKALYYGGDYKRINIPTYPFAGKRHWLKMKCSEEKGKKPVSKTMLHPFIEECTANTYGIRIYASEMAPELQWILKEHKINDYYVLPGTAYIEMAHFAGRQVFQTDQIEINDVVFMSPLVCGEGERRILNIILNTRPEHTDIAIASRNETEEDWVCHVEMSIKARNKESEFGKENADLQQIMKRCRMLEQESFSQSDGIVKLSGLRWDNTKKIWFNETEILEYMSLDESLEEERKQFYLYPTLLDGAVNVGNVLTEGFHLPFSYKKAVFAQELPDRFYSYLRKRTEKKEEEISVFDITIYDENGKEIGYIEEYALKRVRRPEAFIANQKEEQNKYYEIKWVIEKEKKLNSSDKAGKILVICKEGYQKETFIQSLELQSGKEVIVLAIGENYKQDSEKYIVAGNSQEDFNKAVTTVSHSRISDVIYRYDPDTAEEEGIKNTDSMKALFYLVKAILHCNISYDVEFTILTKLAMEVTGEEEGINPAENMLVQAGHCIAAEYNNLKLKVIDRDDATAEDVIIQKIFETGTMFITVLRNNQSYIQKLSAIRPNQEKDKLPLNEKGVYVIAGGFGGMGITFARTILEINPDSTLFLLNRSFDESMELSWIKENCNQKQLLFLEWAADKKVHLVKADLSDTGQLKKVFDRIHQEHGNIDGLIQAAGAKGDGFIYRKEWDTFQAVLNPKVEGTWNLYKMTEQDSMGFFMMCSSFASVFGSAGQSDYVAANAFLDSFSYFLRRKGIKGMVVNWTGWSESGMAYQNKVDTEAGIVEFLTDAEGAAAFEHILKWQRTRVLAGRIRMRAAEGEREELERKIDMSEIQQDREEVVREQKNVNEISDVIITGKSMDKLTDTEKQIIEIWAQTLGVSEIDVNEKFFEAGGNSLLTAALHKGINKIYPGIMSITDIFIYSSVLEISEYIDSKTGKKKPVVFETIEEDDEEIDDLLQKFVNGDISKDMMEHLI
ncbi:type I polyketide synthase [Anaeromicropila populeti]|uniref:Phosphopantetheine attachment site n=1 Tax=Anaeromicropila populeti TaxID=37658 RepID=A0A1I6LYP8_9FIRM|nr:type I polyketide synthase [Anaeromicropila populeti]SFS08599.1 Phosphopantetheine attachment site [Anaeromicropila populeti]